MERGDADDSERIHINYFILSPFLGEWRAPKMSRDPFFLEKEMEK